jgi:hypothetical protein
MKTAFVLVFALMAGCAGGDLDQDLNAGKGDEIDDEGGDDEIPESLYDRVASNGDAIEEQARAAVAADLGGNFATGEMAIHWDSMVCYDAEQSGFEPRAVGTCHVSAGAFQLAAELAIVQGQFDATVVVLHADVE